MGCSLPPIDQREWDVIFDLCSRGFFIPRVLYYPGFVLACALLVCIVLRMGWGERHAEHCRKASYVSIIACIGCAFIVLAVAESWVRLTRAIQRREFTIHQGIVSAFSPGDVLDRRAEAFSIGERRYYVHAAELTAAYSQTAAHGGRVREGLLVQVVDTRGEIARLAVARAR